MPCETAPGILQCGHCRFSATRASIAVREALAWDSPKSTSIACCFCAGLSHHRGRELAYASPPAQFPACALTHGAPASDDDEGQLARLRVLKPIAVTRETPTQSRLRKCVLHRLVGSAEWSFPPAVGFSRRHERLGIPAGPAALDARHTPPGSSALLSYPVNLM